MSSGLLRRTKWARGVAAALVVMALGARIWSVNAHAETIPTETYGLGETVALEGAFAEYAYENTSGYSVCVKAARRMSVRDYLATFASSDEDADAALEGFAAGGSNVTDLDAMTLVVLDLVVTNDKGGGDERGYLDSIGWSIRSESRPQDWIRAETTLLEASIPQANGAYQLSIKSGTQFELHVPFLSARQMDDFLRADDIYGYCALDPGAYSLIVTKAPVRKLVRFDVA